MPMFRHSLRAITNRALPPSRVSAHLKNASIIHMPWRTTTTPVLSLHPLKDYHHHHHALHAAHERHSSGGDDGHGNTRARVQVRGRGRASKDSGEEALRNGSSPHEGAHTITGATDTKKKKVALIVGYCGTGYRGLQYDPHDMDSTIEGVIFEALYRSGFILESNFVEGDPRKISFDRGSRTDKGVHSLCTVLTAKLEFSQQQLKFLEGDPLGLNVAEKINAALPREIKVFSVQRTHSGFRSRHDLQWRKYRYVIPLDMLKDGEASIPKLNEQLKHYLGTKMFHNFTTTTRELLDSGRRNRERRESLEKGSLDSYRDDETNLKRVVRKDDNIVFMRNIYQATCDTVVDDPVSGKKFGIVTFVGASFVRHQIRNMIGTAISAVNGFIPEDYIHLAIESDIKMPTYLAPSEGLYLHSALSRARSQGDTLELQEDLLMKHSYDFQEKILIPHIQELLRDSSVFEKFFGAIKGNALMDEDEYETIRQETDKFIEWRAEKRTQKIAMWKEGMLQKLSDTPIHVMDLHRLVPPAFSTEVCIRNNIIPGPDLSNMLLELHCMMIRREIFPLQTAEYYYDIIDRVGFDTMATRGDATRSNGPSLQKVLADLANKVNPKRAYRRHSGRSRHFKRDTRIPGSN